MKILVTGCEGFVGSYLVKDLLNRNYDVEGIYYTFKPKYDIPLYEIDIRNRESLEKLFYRKYDVIFHLAGQSSGSLSFKKVLLTYDINTTGTLNILNAVNKDIHFIYISTAEVYGRPEILPLKEDDFPVPVNHYAVSKYNAENICRAFSQIYKMDITVLRPFNHTGAGQTPTFVLPSFAKQIAMIEKGMQDPVIKVGNLNVKRDFMNVRDVVDAYIKIMENRKKGFNIYNVSSGRSYLLKDLLNKMIEKSTKSITVEIDKERLRPVDIEDMYGDSSKLQRDTNWKITKSIDDTIEELLNYWRENI